MPNGNFTDKEAILRGLGQGVSMGYLDELYGGLGAIYDAASLAPEIVRSGEIPWQQLGSSYENSRNSWRESDAAANSRSPWQYMAGDVTGSVVSPTPFSKVKALGALGKSALSSGMAALGSSESNNSGDLLADAARGAGTGMIWMKMGDVIKFPKKKGTPDKFLKGPIPDNVTPLPPPSANRITVAIDKPKKLDLWKQMGQEAGDKLREIESVEGGNYSLSYYRPGEAYGYNRIRLAPKSAEEVITAVENGASINDFALPDSMIREVTGTLNLDRLNKLKETEPLARSVYDDLMKIPPSRRQFIKWKNPDTYQGISKRTWKDMVRRLGDPNGEGFAWDIYRVGTAERNLNKLLSPEQEKADKLFEAAKKSLKRGK